MKGHVNLLVADLLEEERFPFQKVALPGAFVLLLAALLAASAWQWKRAHALNREVQQMSQRQTQLTVSLALLKSQAEQRLMEREALQKKAREREQLRERLKAERTPWPALLQALSVLVPQYVWLTEMESFEESQEEKSAKGIKISGFAKSQAGILRLLLALDDSPQFQDARLVYSGKDEEEKRSRFSFEIRATLRQD